MRLSFARQWSSLSHSPSSRFHASATTTPVAGAQCALAMVETTAHVRRCTARGGLLLGARRGGPRARARHVSATYEFFVQDRRAAAQEISCFRRRPCRRSPERATSTWRLHERRTVFPRRSSPGVHSRSPAALDLSGRLWRRHRRPPLPLHVDCWAGTDTWTGTLNVSGLSFDVTPPTLSGLSNKTIRVRRTAKRVRVRFVVTASDQVDGPVHASCKPRSGRLFKVGRTVVTCSATDTSANTATGRFKVVVKRRR